MTDNTKFRTPKEEDLLLLKLVQEEYRNYWNGFPHMPMQPTFEGLLDDIHALDYLSYEGLSYPESGVNGAALIWGNVIAKQMGFTWKIDDRAALR